MPSKRPYNNTELLGPAFSEPIEDRASKFIAAYSTSFDHRSLQALPIFGSASHRILAWRCPSQQSSLNGQPIVCSGHDDDGEKGAGLRLERLLSSAKLQGSIVVARWYGGVMLGPVRFQHIVDCAQQALHRFRAETETCKKRVRLQEEEEQERQELAREMPERDANIVILRKLLESKQHKTAFAGSQENQKPNAKVCQYEDMDLPTLRRLDKARDATVTWILKQIENVEKAS